MWVKRVILEDHCDVPVLGRYVVDKLIAYVDFPRGGFLEPGNHSQGGTLATPGGTDQHDELAVGNVEIDPLHRRRAVEHFDDIAKRDLRHLLPFRHAGRQAGYTVQVFEHGL
jgi:hypothetical protein